MLAPIIGSQSSSTNVDDHEIRPKGIKAAKSRRDNAQGKALAEYKSIWEIKKEDLAMKEKLSKLAILDTLLAKKEPLSEAEEVVKNKLLTELRNTWDKIIAIQPSESEEYGGNTWDSGYNETEDLIRQDQAEIIYNNAEPVQYPPQPEVEFGIPKTCYCGGQPLLATSYTRNDPGRRYYTCENVDDRECHVWKWWDVAETQLNQVKDLQNDTEQKLVKLEKIVCELAKKKSRFTNGFELVVDVMVIVLVLIGEEFTDISRLKGSDDERRGVIQELSSASSFAHIFSGCLYDIFHPVDTG
ncbi:hypothetical protein F2Q69_00033775 [Brassica cretica]|uniref:GRF-type domain-containing protein n=1 Tax=Brassica cretica TaxID=69181 RepID=A0A8S9SBW1_BRACR|nr:hypothetical protein F2Q69_00033775 [Brassica cretica]